MESKKQYTWEPDAQIPFTGKEFELFYNSLKLFLISPISPQSFVMINDLYMLLGKKFEKMIEEGIAKDVSTMEKATEQK